MMIPRPHIKDMPEPKTIEDAERAIVEAAVAWDASRFGTVSYDAAHVRLWVAVEDLKRLRNGDQS